MNHATRPTKSSPLTLIERNLRKKDEFYSRFRYPDWAKRCLLSLLSIEKDVEQAQTTEAILEAMAELVAKNAPKPALKLISKEVLS